MDDDKKALEMQVADRVKRAITTLQDNLSRDLFSDFTPIDINYKPPTRWEKLKRFIDEIEYRLDRAWRSLKGERDEYGE